MSTEGRERLREALPRAKGPVVGWRWADALRTLHDFGLTYEEQPEGIRAALAAAALAHDRPSGAVGLREAAQRAIDSGDTFRGREELSAALSGSSDPEPTMAGYASKKDAWEDGYDAGVMHGRYLASSDHTFVRDAAARPETPA